MHAIKKKCRQNREERGRQQESRRLGKNGKLGNKRPTLIEERKKKNRVQLLVDIIDDCPTSFDEIER